MAEGTYRLIKENSGGSFDEKTVLAENGKVLGFDASMNPVMVTRVPIIATNTTLTVKASGGDYTTIQGALDYLSGYLIATNVFVTIEVDDGTFTSSTTISLSHLNGDRIKIVGKNTYSTSLTSIQSVGSHSTDGVTGRKYYDYVLNVSSVANIVTGDFVLIPAPANGTTPYLLMGSGEVQNVDAVNTRITVRIYNQYAASNASGAVTDTLTIIKSIVSMTGNDYAFTLQTRIGSIHNLVVKGANLMSGIYGGTGTVLNTLGTLVFSTLPQALNITGADGFIKDIFASNCNIGINLGNGARIVQNGTCGFYINGCSDNGINNVGGFIRISKIYVVGVTKVGAFVSWGARLIVSSGATANVDIQRCGTYGIQCANHALAVIGYCNIQNNTTADVYAQGGSYVDVVAGTTGTESPTVNTIGNDNAYIKQ